MGHEASLELEEFFDIMEALEIPVCRHYTNIAVYRPRVLPETLDQIRDFMESSAAIKPRFERREIGHSMTRNWYNMLASNHLGVNVTGTGSFVDGEINVKVVAGDIEGSTVFPIEFQETDFLYQSTYGNYTWQGIWIGTGNAAETFNDYNLDTKILHGDSAGRLRYFEQRVPKKEWSAGTRQWTVTARRYFTNHSGGSISVAEMGMVGEVKENTITWYAMLARDVLGSPVAVADDELFMAEYEIVSSVWPS